MSIAPKAEHDRNAEATVYLGNLDDRCSDGLVWELMLQAGPVSNVFLPKDRVSGTHQGFGFCEFLSEQDADYAVKIMNQIKLYGKPIRASRASYESHKQVNIGANLFIGNLDESVDESQIYDTFQTFGAISEQPKIARDPTTGQSKGYGFISYHDFEAADMAIENMTNQFFGGKQITVQYQFKKDGKGERHGTTAERLMASQAKKNSMLPGAGPNAGGLGFQGRYSGALSGSNAVPAPQSAQIAPPPPPGMPIYQPPGGGGGGGAQYPGQGPPVHGQGYPPQGPPQGAPQGYPQGFAPQGYATGANGYGAPPPPPMPVGFGGQGQGQGQGQGPNGYPVPQGQMPGQGQGYGGQQGYQGGAPPPPPPPIRMGFE